MRPEERDPAYLWDILDAAKAILEYTQGLTLEEFLSSGKDREIVRLAVERQLEIIGEAARRVSSQFREAHAHIPWSEIIGLRNVISHQYDKVNYEAIYYIIRKDLPGLVEALEKLVPSPPPFEE